MDVYKLVTSIEERDSVRPRSHPNSRSPSVSTATPQSTPSRNNNTAARNRFIAPSFDNSASAKKKQQENSPQSSAAARTSPAMSAGGRSRPVINSSASQARNASSVNRTLNMSDESSSHMYANAVAMAVHTSSSSPSAPFNFSDPSLYLNASVEEKEAAMRYAEELVKQLTSAADGPSTPNTNASNISVARADEAITAAATTSAAAAVVVANQYYSPSMDTSMVSISNHHHAAAATFTSSSADAVSRSHNQSLHTSGVRNSPQKPPVLIASSLPTNATTQRNHQHLHHNNGMNTSTMPPAPSERSVVIPSSSSALMTVGTADTTTAVSMAETSPAAVFLSPEVTHLRNLLQEKLNNGVRAAFEAFTEICPHDAILRQLLEESLRNGNNNAEVVAANGAPASSSSLPLLVHTDTAWRRVGEAVAEHMHSSLSAGYDALASELAVARGEMVRQQHIIETLTSETHSMTVRHKSRVADLEQELKTALEMNVLLMEEASQSNALRRQLEESIGNTFSVHQQQMNRLMDGETNSRWFCVVEESRSFVRLLSEHNTHRNALLDIEVRADLQQEFHDKLEFLKAMQEQWRADAVSASSSEVDGKEPLLLEEEEDEEGSHHAFKPRPPPGISPRREREQQQQQEEQALLIVQLKARQDAMRIEALNFEESASRAVAEQTADRFVMNAMLDFTTTSKRIIVAEHDERERAAAAQQIDGGLSPLTDGDRIIHDAEAAEEANARRLEAEFQQQQAWEQMEAAAIDSLVSTESATRVLLERAIINDCVASFAVGANQLCLQTMQKVKAADLLLSDAVAASFQEELRRDFFEQQKSAVAALDEFWTAEVDSVHAAHATKSLSLILHEEESSRKILENIANDSVETIFSVVTSAMRQTTRHTLAIDDLKAQQHEALALLRSHLLEVSDADKRHYIERQLSQQREVFFTVVELESDIRNELLMHFATQRIGILAEFFEVGAAVQTQHDVSQATQEVTFILTRQFEADREADARETEISLQQRQDLLEEKFELEVAVLEEKFASEKMTAVCEAIDTTRQRTAASSSAVVAALVLDYAALALEAHRVCTAACNSSFAELMMNVKSCELKSLQLEHEEKLLGAQMESSRALLEAVTDARRGVEDKYKALYDETIQSLSESYEARITAQREELYAEIIDTAANRRQYRRDRNGSIVSSSSSAPPSAPPSLMQTPVKIRTERNLLAADRQSVLAQKEALAMLSASSSVANSAVEVLRAMAEQHKLAVEVEFQRAQMAVQTDFIVSDRVSRESYEEELVAALADSENREELAKNALSALQEEYSLLMNRNVLLSSQTAAMDAKLAAAGETHTLETNIAVQTIEALRADYEAAVGDCEDLQQQYFIGVSAEICDSEHSLRTVVEQWARAEWNLLRDLYDTFALNLKSTLRRFETNLISQKAEETDKLVTAVVTNIVDSNANLTATLRDHRAADEAVVRATVDESVLGALTTAFGASSSSSSLEEGASSSSAGIDIVCASLAGRIAEQLHLRFRVADDESSDSVPTYEKKTSAETAASIASHSALLTKLEKLEQLLEAQTTPKNEEASSSYVDVAATTAISLEAQIASLKADAAVTTVSIESSLAILSSLVSVLGGNASALDVEDDESSPSSSSSSPASHHRLFSTTQHLFRVLHESSNALGLLRANTARRSPSPTTADEHSSSPSAQQLVLEGQLIAAKSEVAKLRMLFSSLKESTNRQLSIIAASTQTQIEEEMLKFSTNFEQKIANDVESLATAAKRLGSVGSAELLPNFSFETVIGTEVFSLLSTLRTELSTSSRADSTAFEERIQQLKQELATEISSGKKNMENLSNEHSVVRSEQNDVIATLKTEIAVSEERIVALQSALSDANGRYEALFVEANTERSTLTTRIDTLMSEKQVDAAKIALLETDLKHFKEFNAQTSQDRENYWREKCDTLSESIANEKNTVEKLYAQIELQAVHERSLEAKNTTLRSDVEQLNEKISEIELRFASEKSQMVANFKDTHEKETIAARTLWDEKLRRLQERLDDATEAAKSSHAEMSTDRSTHAAALSALRAEHQNTVAEMKDSHERLLQSTVQQLTAEHEARVNDLKSQLATAADHGEKSLSAVKSQLAKTSHELDTLRATFAALSEEHAILKEGPMMRLKIGEESLTRQVTELSETISEYRTKMQQMEEETNRLRELLADSEKHFGTSEANFKECAAKLDATIRERDLAHEQLSRLEKQLATVGDDVNAVRRTLHETEMELTELKSVLSSTQTNLTIAQSERQEIFASKLELERQLLDLQSGKHADLSALQLKIGSLTRRIMDEERRNGDLHRRCLEKDASLKRFSTVSHANVVSAAANTAIITESRATLQRLLDVNTGGVATSSAAVGNNSPSPIPLDRDGRQSTAPMLGGGHSQHHSGGSVAPSVSSNAAVSNVGKYSSIARDIQMERLKSSVDRRSPSTGTANLSPLMLLASATRTEATSRQHHHMMMMGGGAGGSDNALLKKLSPMMGLVSASNTGTDDDLAMSPTPLHSDRAHHRSGPLAASSAAPSASSLSPDAQLYLRYSASPDGTAAGSSVGAPPLANDNGRGNFSDLQHLAISGRAHFGSSVPSFVPVAKGEDGLKSAASSASPRSTNGPSASPTLVE